MCQSHPVYHESPSLALLEPWMLARLPKVVDPTARAHIIQLAAGIFESHSALIANIARTSAFQANTDDESSHGSDFNIFSVNLISDASAIPLGWRIDRHR